MAAQHKDLAALAGCWGTQAPSLLGVAGCKLLLIGHEKTGSIWFRFEWLDSGCLWLALGYPSAVQVVRTEGYMQVARWAC